MSTVDESSKVVYVGHLPFDMTEEQIKDIFKTAGPVKQIRLVFDRATGKSKGFAFVQYFQPESAESAVRNLDKHKVGNKQLRVNYSSGKFFDGKNGAGKHESNGGMPDGGDDEMSGIVPEIVDFVSTVPPPQKQQMLNELKQFIGDNPGVSRKFLEQNPQVTYAVVQCMFELGKIDGNSASSLILNEQQLQQQNMQPQPVQQPVQQPPQMQQPPQQPQASQSKRKRPSRQASAPPPMLTTPRVELSEDQKQMYRQIVSLTPEQLNAMPSEQQQAALKIRSQVESGLISI